MSKIDTVHSRHVMLEVLQVVKDKRFGLHRMATREPLACWGVLKVIINIIYHLVNSNVSPRPAFMSSSIIFDIDNTLSLLICKRERVFRKRLLFR